MTELSKKKDAMMVTNTLKMLKLSKSGLAGIIISGQVLLVKKGIIFPEISMIKNKIRRSEISLEIKR